MVAERDKKYAVMKRKKAEYIILLLKIIVTAGIFFYLIRYDKIAFHSIVRILNNIELLITILLLLLGNTFMSFYRWNILLKGQKIYINARDIISIGFIGLFFSAFMPGAYGGDLVKSVYIARKVPNSKITAVFTVVFDRIIGFVSIILIADVGLIIQYNQIMSNAILLNISIIILCLSLTIFLFFIICFLLNLCEKRILMNFLLKLPFSKIFVVVYQSIVAYRNKTGLLLRALIISLVCNIINVSSWYLIAYALDFHSLTFMHYLIIVPVGKIVSALPITPAGIGVGQVVNLKLFEWFAGCHSTIGSDVATIWQVIVLSIFLTGGIFFIAYKSSPQVD